MNSYFRPTEPVPFQRAANETPWAYEPLLDNRFDEMDDHDEPYRQGPPHWLATALALMALGALFGLAYSIVWVGGMVP